MREGEPLFDWEVIAVQKRLKAFRDFEGATRQSDDSQAANQQLPPPEAPKSLWQRLIGRDG